MALLLFLFFCYKGGEPAKSKRLLRLWRVTMQQRNGQPVTMQAVNTFRSPILLPLAAPFLPHSLFPSAIPPPQ
ncbi:hypothetical protein GW17_00011569 [Ensete ventricosum]|uniref:Uncharacterized protein n=1 Tax=Ensete ventricosum TaxID=4639 RepID=A0A427B5Y9_ENSVE|nr:hypothetical protein B296_00004501 [Ensete ventricosum]RWW24153.1 hypothetical protein GW17_00011569 [Ensete ventricosum]RZR76989.1 hypothetical protein BHM03_00001920 [Ensete ventricosum]